MERLILSHLHYDHCGGVHDVTANEVLVSKTEWRAAAEPDALSMKSIRPCDLAAIAPRLRLVEAPGQIAPGLELLFTPGHTAGHLSLLIDDEILCVADLIPTRAHLRPDWIMGYDLYPLSVLAQKRRILELAGQRGWRLILPHEPEPALVDVRLGGSGFSAQTAK
ncbi:MAG: putative quorum-quenching lactonase YtnP [Deltaproteobacteria bacterium ADurb.Bin510]|nr:MAG: putative quorum-quenching lactonase YtnP [Deltaproteobacteria bacterium ADurb.Bin510]